MLTRFKQQAQQRRIAADLYGAIVSAARLPAHFIDRQVPDSPMGRLELILVHMSLMIERLQQEGAPGQALAQVLAEAYVADMDDNLREIGIGDVGVATRVKQAAGALYERHRAYCDAWTQADGERLAATLARFIPLQADAAGMALLAGHVRRLREHLGRQPGTGLLQGEVNLNAGDHTS